MSVRVRVGWEEARVWGAGRDWQLRGLTGDTHPSLQLRAD